MTQTPMLMRGALTARVYVVTTYKDLGEGRFEAIAKYDVTDQFLDLPRVIDDNDPTDCNGPSSCVHKSLRADRDRLSAETDRLKTAIRALCEDHSGHDPGGWDNEHCYVEVGRIRAVLAPERETTP